MDEVLAYLEKCKTYYVSTLHDGDPDVRPFGTILKFEGKLYFQTDRTKNVYHQLIDHPRIAICANTSRGEWLRIYASAIEDQRIEPAEAMIEKYPELANMYQPGDGICALFYLQDVDASINSFTGEPKTYRF